jgi:hypothetical protein
MTNTYAADFYSYAQSEESDPDPVHHVQADTVGELLFLMNELLDPMFTNISYKFIDNDDTTENSFRLQAVSPIDERTLQINGVVDVYELKDGE